MQLGQAQVVRSNWYDRGLTMKEYASTLSPAVAGFTVRESYTVPANRAAIVTMLPISLRRNIASAPVGLYSSYYGITPVGDAISYFGKAASVKNGVDDLTEHPINTRIRMVAGDKLDWITADNSTGGSVTFTGGFIVNEYDA